MSSITSPAPLDQPKPVSAAPASTEIHPIERADQATVSSPIRPLRLVKPLDVVGRTAPADPLHPLSPVAHTTTARPIHAVGPVGRSALNHPVHTVGAIDQADLVGGDGPARLDAEVVPLALVRSAGPIVPAGRVSGDQVRARRRDRNRSWSREQTLAVVDRARRLGVQWTLAAGARREAGMSTAEYAVGTIAACGFAALLFKVVTSGEVQEMLAALIQKALNLAG
ncbi:DUF4244 domain-containing protein [Acrocarpospora pleiomorpha]